MPGWDGYGHMGWMALWWVVGLALLVALVWVIARAAAGPGERARGESPEEILKQRYARGEIDRETYEQMLRDLRR
ncbi:MAG: SHOCT domain-containing protein [Deltaproteobacteria bacterium]|nr:MAG: SHOCT domain-containing protein [Deltaproteobacteria bacterium]